MANGNEKDQKNGIKEGTSNHPSRDLSARANGFGIAAGYERPYRKAGSKAAGTRPNPPRLEPISVSDSHEVYGPLPPAGYYGSGTAARPFERGQAGFDNELSWYRLQYGENTSGQGKPKK